jgi:F-box domain
VLDDPLDIPHLTSYILSYLETTSRESESPLPELANLQVLPSSLSSFEKLHIEILGEITSHLSATSALRLSRCSQTLRRKICPDQLFWRDQLISGGLISWLWDLDATQCYTKDAEMSGKDTQWDWKRLAKMLATEPIVTRALARSDDIREARTGSGSRTEWQDGKMVDLPKGLANRCRIVKIVEDLKKLELSEKELGGVEAWRHKQGECKGKAKSELQSEHCDYCRMEAAKKRDLVA